MSEVGCRLARMSEELEAWWEAGVATGRGSQHPRDMGEQPPRREATYKDLEQLPPNVVGELVDGVLYASPREVPGADARLLDASAHRGSGPRHACE